MERFIITGLDGEAVAEVTATAADKILGRKDGRRIVGSDLTLGDLYTFYAFRAALRLGLTDIKDPMEWAATIADVDMTSEPSEPVGEEGEGGATPA
jgi:hypothetical protein